MGDGPLFGPTYIDLLLSGLSVGKGVDKYHIPDTASPKTDMTGTQWL